MKNLAILLLALCAGCASERNNVVVGTSTVIGLSVAQNPASQLYEAKLGYARVEVALIPTNKRGTNAPTTGNGAADTANVLMELHYANIFSFTDAGIYQRLAVGSIAVAQPGASLMFSKSPTGVVNPAVLTTLLPPPAK